jgi:hypothetical protein
LVGSKYLKMKRGITVTNYLVNGDPEGIIYAYVSNWSGQAIKIPRNLFTDAKALPEINRPGVYFLFGRSVENPEDRIAYAGEGNNVANRLADHMRNEDMSFCEVIVCFTSKDDGLSVSHTKYLEQKVIQCVSSCADYKMSNGKGGNNISLSAMARDEMETFFDNMKIVLPTMGYSVLNDEKIVERKASTDSDLLFLKVSDWKASAKLTSNGLEVLKGSIANPIMTPALNGSYVNLRKTLLDKKIIIETGGKLIFEHNYEFSSPSSAGAVILGYSVNGREFWKNKAGKSINDIEKEQLI